MNCQKGDLAMIVESAAGNEGVILTCLHLWGGTLMKCPDGTTENVPIWVTNRELRAWSGQVSNRIADYQLRPIRDPGPDAVDETIQRLGTPMDMRLRELENELAKMNESLDRLEKVLTR